MKASYLVGMLLSLKADNSHLVSESEKTIEMTFAAQTQLRQQHILLSPSFGGWNHKLSFTVDPILFLFNTKIVPKCLAICISGSAWRPLVAHLWIRRYWANFCLLNREKQAVKVTISSILFISSKQRKLIFNNLRIAHNRPFEAVSIWFSLTASQLPSP